VTKLLHLSLFSGIAGFELGFRILERQAGLRVRTVGYVDHDRRRCELIEWLMGFPAGWTASGPLATRSYRQWLQAFSRCCCSERLRTLGKYHE